MAIVSSKVGDTTMHSCEKHSVFISSEVLVSSVVVLKSCGVRVGEGGYN